MNRNIHRQIAQERGVDIRLPSTANLTIDSTDRVGGSSNNFLIVPGQQIINGHFTRAAVQEVAISWGISNINDMVGNNTFSVSSPVAVDTYTTDVSGGVFEGSTPLTNYYDPTDYDGVTLTKNPIILVNGLPTVIIPANLPILDPEGAPIDINGAPILGEQIEVTFPNRFYTVAAIMDTLASTLTSKSTGGYVTYTTTASSTYGAVCKATITTGGANATIQLNRTVLTSMLGMLAQTLTNTSLFYPNGPDIMPWRYIDITCDQLTYCQDVKDSTTNSTSRDVLYRWNFGSLGPDPLDKYGFTIQQGYQSFCTVRNIAFPKQIKWDPIQTLANLSFQSYVGAGFQVNASVKNGGFVNGFVPTLVTGAIEGSGYEFQIVLLLSEI